MTSPTQPKQWISLGMLFGGHTSTYEEQSPPLRARPAPSPPPLAAPLAAEEYTMAETMRAGRYEPKVRAPSARSMPWPSVCITCGAPGSPRSRT